VLTIARLRPDASERTYYERTVASSREDYYAGRGEARGEWFGSGAADLGLEGAVADGELSALLGGHDPVSGALLRTPPAPKLVSRTRIDPSTGERVTEALPHHPVAGFDLTFSAPKSVSLLYALSEPEVQAEVAEAHACAWQDATRLLEDEACVVRRGHNGVVRQRSGFVAAGFQHRTNRDADPHLHTHVVVANLARGSDGRWRALDAQLFIRDWRHAVGHLYHARLRYELTRRLGVEWGPVTKGQADLAHVPDAVIAEFSRRRQTVLEHSRAHGASGYAGRQRAQVVTRPDKGALDWTGERARWAAHAAEHGLTDQARAHLCAGARTPRAPDVERVRAEVLGPNGLTARSQTFTEADLVCAWASAHADGATGDQVRAHVRTSACAPEVVRTGEVRLGAPARLTTREILTCEQAALAVAVRGRGAGGGCARNDHVAQAVRAQAVALSDEQVQVAHAVATRADRVVCVVGRAGAGKTTAIAAGARALEADGVPVVGAAPSAQAARTLSGAAGIEARTLHQVLADARRTPLVPGSVLVVDEASMADTRTLGAVLAHAEEKDVRVVLVGDPAQLPAVGPGGLFAALCEREGCVRLEGNHRQREEWERDALARLRSGHAHTALEAYAAHGRVRACAEADELRAQLVADWWRATTRVGADQAVMLAHRRSEVRALNDAARELCAQAGLVGEDAVRAGGREFAVGDRVVARRNDRRLGVVNGARGTVEGVDQVTQTVQVRTDGGDLVELPATYSAHHLDHAYALTVHAAQGATVAEAFVLASDQGRLAEWGYVALSRAREQTQLYVLEAREPCSLGPLEPAPLRPSLDDLAAGLAVPAAEPLATEQVAGARAGRQPPAVHRGVGLEL